MASWSIPNRNVGNAGNGTLAVLEVTINDYRSINGNTISPATRREKLKKANDLIEWVLCVKRSVIWFSITHPLNPSTVSVWFHKNSIECILPSQHISFECSVCYVRFSLFNFFRSFIRRLNRTGAKTVERRICWMQLETAAPYKSLADMRRLDDSAHCLRETNGKCKHVRITAHRFPFRLCCFSNQKYELRALYSMTLVYWLIWGRLFSCMSYHVNQ